MPLTQPPCSGGSPTWYWPEKQPSGFIFEWAQQAVLGLLKVLMPIKVTCSCSAFKASCSTSSKDSTVEGVLLKTGSDQSVLRWSKDLFPYQINRLSFRGFPMQHQDYTQYLFVRPALPDFCKTQVLIFMHSEVCW